MCVYINDIQKDLKYYIAIRDFEKEQIFTLLQMILTHTHTRTYIIYIKLFVIIGHLNLQFLPFREDKTSAIYLFL
jgi:glycerol-3-phosphate acyltransferase PlsY